MVKRKGGENRRIQRTGGIRMKRKLLALLLCGSMLAALAACGEDAPEASGSAPVADDPTPSQSEPAEPTEETTPPPPPEPTVATLAVCGDAMSHMPVTNDAWSDEKGTYDYVPLMDAVQPYVSAADYAVVNLETTLAGGPNYSGYPTFNTPDEFAYCLKDMGFDLCLTANNHSLDKWYDGLARTLDVLDELDMAHVGTSRTQEEADNNIYVADVGGISVAFLGYTYGTNGIPVSSEHPYCINLFNTDYMTTLSTPDLDRLAADLDAAEALEPDLIAVMIHWGVEYQTTENAYQDQIADYLFENGADIVLGGHSHVLQPMGTRTLADGRQGFVSYSLGNFFSGQLDFLTKVTVVLTLELTRDNVTGETQVTGYSYVPFYMYHDTLNGARGNFELIDAHRALDSGVTDAALAQTLTEAIEASHDILGAEYDYFAAPGEGADDPNIPTD